MAIVKIQIRRKTSQEWLNTNPIILPGEMGFELDTGRLKIGRESAEHWNDVPYVVTMYGAHTHKESDIIESVCDLETANGVIELNLEQYSHFNITINADTYINVNTSSILRRVNRFSLKIINGANHKIVWPSNFLWSDGVEPTLSNEMDLLSFFTDDSGSTWLNVSFIKNIKRR